MRGTNHQWFFSVFHKIYYFWTARSGTSSESYFQLNIFNCQTRKHGKKQDASRIRSLSHCKTSILYALFLYLTPSHVLKQNNTYAKQLLFTWPQLGVDFSSLYFCGPLQADGYTTVSRKYNGMLLCGIPSLYIFS